jgi:hypothetical protein
VQIYLQSTSNDNSDYNVPKAEEYNNDNNSYDDANNKSRAQLLEMLQECNRKIKALESEVAKIKCKQRENKKQI